jgi:DNA-binding MarR family transcriptional regulator
MGQINSLSTALVHRVEALIGLRLGELQVLLAISEGADHPRAVASGAGQVTAAVSATVEALVKQSLVGRHHHPAAPAGSDPILLHLTDSGTTAVQRAEGIQIRVLGALATALGHRRTSDLREGMQALATAIDSSPLPADSGNPPHGFDGGHAQLEESNAHEGALIRRHNDGDRQPLRARDLREASDRGGQAIPHENQ